MEDVDDEDVQCDIQESLWMMIILIVIQSRVYDPHTSTKHQNNTKNILTDSQYIYIFIILIIKYVYIVYKTGLTFTR